MIELSLEEARWASVAAQLLDGNRPAIATGVVRALGARQVDPVASVARAERMVLFSRLGPYDVAELEAALARGELFEYWAHIVASSDYREGVASSARVDGEGWALRDVLERDPGPGRTVVLSRLEMDVRLGRRMPRAWSRALRG